MDALTEFVRLLAPQGRLELHCRFAGGWLVDQGAALAGHVPYHVVLEGRGRVEIGQGRGGLRVELAAGDVVLFPHGAAHGLRSLGEPAVKELPSHHFNGAITRVEHLGAPVQLELLCGHFVLGTPGGLLLRSLPPVLVLHTAERADCAWLRGLVGMMRAEAEAVLPGGLAVVAQLSTALFTVLLRMLMADGGVRHGLLALLGEPRLVPAVQAVLQAPAEPWTVATLAARCHMARATFARRFTQLGGLTPLALVTSLRMEHAARLMVLKNLAARQAAEACGYASDAAFGRAFRQHFGVTPKAYRVQARARLEP